MEPQPGRWTARLDGDFVVFLLGARVHDPGVSGQVTDLLLEMVHMLAELETDPAHGLLGYAVHGPLGDGVIVQYWRSFEALEHYARNPQARHAPVWRAWNRLAEADQRGAGIWHETFQVAAGAYEAIYANMPVMGLQQAGEPLPLSEARTSARARLES